MPAFPHRRQITGRYRNDWPFATCDCPCPIVQLVLASDPTKKALDFMPPPTRQIDPTLCPGRAGRMPGSAVRFAQAEMDRQEPLGKSHTQSNEERCEGKWVGSPGGEIAGTQIALTVRWNISLYGRPSVIGSHGRNANAANAGVIQRPTPGLSNVVASEPS